MAEKQVVWRCGSGTDNESSGPCPCCGAQPPPWLVGRRRDGPTKRRAAQLWSVVKVGGGVLVLAAVLLVAIDRATKEDAIDVGELAIDLDAEVAALRTWVSEARGLPFTKEVPVRVVPDEAFLVALDRAGESAVGSSVRHMEELSHAIGILSDGDDLPGVLDQLARAGVAGFYDPSVDEIVVRGSPTVGILPVLVHELVHALQDQHFDLSTPRADADQTDAQLAFAAIFEGDASRIESRYLGELDDDTRELIALDWERTMSDDDLATYRALPSFIRDEVQFLYRTGQSYIEYVENIEGVTAVDAMFTAPPLTTAHVLRRELPGGAIGVAVPPPTPKGVPRRAGVLGQLSIRSLLEGSRFAETAASQWSGDAYVIDDRDRELCFVGRFASTSDEPRSLGAELRLWATRRGGSATRESPGAVLVEICAGKFG